jgi:hypothetical protein
MITVRFLTPVMLILKDVLGSQAWYSCDCNSQVCCQQSLLDSASGGAGSTIFLIFSSGVEN